jgi:GTP cyclohydrolase I
MDKKKIEKAIELLLTAIGEDPKREGLKNTPRRVADYYEEVLEGMDVNPLDILSVYYEKENHE